MTARRARDDAEPDGVWAQTARIAFRFLFGAVGLIAVGWSLSNIRQVQPDSWAVVLRFGAVARQQGAGLLMAWPRPIEQVVMLPSSDRQIQIRIARFDGDAEQPAAPVQPTAPAQPTETKAAPPVDSVPGFDMSEDPRKNAGFLLTGDFSVAHLQATLFYQISDPVAYLTEADHVGPALERLFIASAVAECASRDLDTILVARPELNQNESDAFRSGREQLRSDLVQAVNRRLDDLARQGAGLGVTVSRVDLVPAIPGSAKEEFDHVLVVTQAAEAQIAEARTDAELAAQHARQDADSIAVKAVAAANERVNTAKERTAAIAALAGQVGAENRQMLFNRVYFARVGAMLGRMEAVQTVDGEGGTHVILPGPRANER